MQAFKALQRLRRVSTHFWWKFDFVFFVRVPTVVQRVFDDVAKLMRQVIHGVQDLDVVPQVRGVDVYAAVGLSLLD